FVSGLGTMMAALVAYAAILIESRRARAAEAAIERRLATQVYCWLEPRSTPEGREWILCFENNVGVPIYSWSVKFADETMTITSKEHGPIRPKSSQLKIDDLRGQAHASVPGLVFVFTDPTGLVWTRSSDGRLSLIAGG